MATDKRTRGTKRTCQNSDCGSRFYDLNRDPITCPICDAPFVIVVAPAPVIKKVVVPVKKPAAPAKEEEAKKDEDDLDDIEVADDADDADDSKDADDTFLETEEEDGTEVTEIIGTPAPKKEGET